MDCSSVFHLFNRVSETSIQADNPTHLIHFNGERFFGPHNSPDVWQLIFISGLYQGGNYWRNVCAMDDIDGEAPETRFRAWAAELTSVDAVSAIVNGMHLARSPARRTEYEGLYADDSDKRDALLALHGLTVRGDALSDLIFRFLQTPYA
jgi:hypothetical protein